MTWQNKFYDQFDKSFSEQSDVEPIKFTDGIGYSIVGDYPNNYKRLMGVGREDAYKPMYKFAVRQDSGDGEYLPMYISAGLTLEEDENGRKRYILSYGKIRGITPVDFTSKDDFYVNKATGELFEKVGKKYKKLSYSRLFERVKRAHLSRLTDIRAIYLRSRILVFRKIPSAVLAGIAFLSGIIVWIIEGKRFKYDVIEESFREGFEPERTEEATPEPREQIDFFGYKLSIWTLATFSLFFLGFTILSEHVRVPYYAMLFQSPGPMLTIAVAIISIVFYDKITPFLLKRVVKSFQIHAYNLKYKGLRLKV